MVKYKKEENNFMVEKPLKAKKPRRKKLTKSQEEKRNELLENILNKWVCVKQSYDDDDDASYVFMLHVPTDENSNSKLYQIVLSGDPLSDGVYLITDYDISMVYNNQNKKQMIELKPTKFDLKAGKYAEEIVTNTYEDLKEHLINAQYLTEEEFSTYCQNRKVPQGVTEMLLEYNFDSRERGN